MDLTTRYMGLELKNPLVASASPLTGELDSLRELEDAGAAAVVLPSLFQEQIEAEAGLSEELALAGADSFPEAGRHPPTQRIERTGPERYLTLVRSAAETLDIPVIASLNGTTNEGWIRYAREIEQAGADGLELNIYLIATDRATTGRDVERRYLEILTAVRESIAIPVAVKLNPHFSALRNMAEELDRAGAGALVLFNRFYQPDINLTRLRITKDLDLSRAQDIRLPLLWIGVLARRISASLAASTGVESSAEVVKYLLAGADVVMTTSALLRNGPSYIYTLLCHLRAWLSVRDITSLDQVRGRLSRETLGPEATSERASYLAILHAYGR